MNQVLKRKFQETSIFYVHDLKGFREMIYFERNVTIFACTVNALTNSICVYNLSEVNKFLGDKKGPTKGFLS